MSACKNSFKGTKIALTVLIIVLCFDSFQCLVVITQVLSQLRLYSNIVTDLKLRVTSVLALLVFLKRTLPNVFSTLQSKLGGDLTFSLLYHRGHLQIIIYLFKSICFPALTAFRSCSVDHLSQRTVPTTVACIAGFKVHWWKSQLLWLGRSCCWGHAAS